MTLPKVPPNFRELQSILATRQEPDEARHLFIKRLLRLVVAHHGQARVAETLGINVSNLRRTLHAETLTRLDALCRAAHAVDLEVTLAPRPPDPPPAVRASPDEPAP